MDISAIIKINSYHYPKFEEIRLLLMKHGAVVRSHACSFNLSQLEPGPVIGFHKKKWQENSILIYLLSLALFIGQCYVTSYHNILF
jgi:hypothetical protein